MKDKADEMTAASFLISVAYLESLLLAETTVPVSEYSRIYSISEAKKFSSKEVMAIDA
jgi:hypothetical protein